MPGVGDQLDRVRSAHEQVEHVVRLVEEHGGLLPRLLLPPPVGELRGDHRVDVGAELGVAQQSDGVAGLVEQFLQILGGHVRPFSSGVTSAGPAEPARGLVAGSRLAIASRPGRWSSGVSRGSRPPDCRPPSWRRNGVGDSPVVCSLERLLWSSTQASVTFRRPIRPAGLRRMTGCPGHLTYPPAGLRPRAATAESGSARVAPSGPRRGQTMARRPVGRELRSRPRSIPPGRPGPPDGPHGRRGGRRRADRRGRGRAAGPPGRLRAQPRHRRLVPLDGERPRRRRWRAARVAGPDPGVRPPDPVRPGSRSSSPTWAVRSSTP